MLFLVSCFSELFCVASSLNMRNILLTSSFLLAIFVITSHAKLTKECLVDYLKFRNVVDETFDSIEAYTGDPGTCSSAVATKVNEIYGVTRSKMESNFKQKPYADCAMKEVETRSYEHVLLTVEVVEMKGVGLKFWKISSKNSKIEELKKKAQEFVDNAIIKCKGETDYGAFFDSFYEQKRSEPMTDEFEYCMKKFLVDKGVVNSNLYNFKLNPKNLRTAGINCDDMMATALDQMRANIGNAGSSCVIDAFLTNGYLDLIMKIQLMAKLTLSPTEKEFEKDKFVKSMINMTHKIKECPI